jgi:predicted  nucleic acid-binding Zn-ribbon protein
MLPDLEIYRWWPIEYCDPVAVVEDFDIAAHRKQVLSLLSELADERRTVTDLRKTVANLTQLTTSLESQVVALRADLQIEDVKVGDVVEIMTKTGRYQDQDTVVEIEAISDGSCEPYIRLQHGGWWEPSRLRLLRRPPLTVGTDTAQLSTERLAATEAIRYAQQLERTLAEVKSEAETKIKSLESQVVALRAEVQKVGKQLQHGSRFALLELD